MNGDLALVADPQTVMLAPNASGNVQFVLTSRGVPVGGQTVKFEILDTVQAQGATLAATSAITDVTGTAAVVVRTGLETEFRVHGSSGSVAGDALVSVHAGTSGDVVVVPFFAPSSTAAQLQPQIEVRFFVGNRCSDLSPTHPPLGVRPYLLTMGQTSATFPGISTSEPSAIIGLANDSHAHVIAAGCVDLAGANVLPGGSVQVALPLYDVVPDPLGTFSVISDVTFSPPLAAAAILAAPWRDLADCPLDPAQLWLDCTMDALSPVTADDPLDCVPASGAGAEGPLGDLLAARRGVHILDGGGNVTACRGAQSAGGAISADAIVFGLYGSPLPPAVVALPDIANDAAHLLDRLKLKSALNVAASGTPSSYVVTHTLESVTLGRVPARDSMDTVTEIPLVPLGLPVLTAYPTASTRDGTLSLARHGFTLRLGTTARAWFSADALENRGLPSNVADLPAALAALAHSGDGGAQGCEAMDHAVCPTLGKPTGCLVAACAAGLDALAHRLEAGFNATDTSGLDLYLAGYAPLLDLKGNGPADHLGQDLPNDDSQKGIWSAEVRTGLDHATFAGSFVGAN